MKQKGVIKNTKSSMLIAVILFLVILITAVLFLKSYLKLPPKSVNQPLIPKVEIEPKEKVVDWEKLLPSLMPNLQNLLQNTFPDTKYQLGEKQPVSIHKQVDITGDGIPEALINLGTGGATIDFLTLMRIENDQPVYASFKKKDGVISPMIFNVGAGGAGRYGSNVEMLPDKNAIYYGEYSQYGESTDYCFVDAYQWNPETKLFEYNPTLSKEIQKGYCQKVRPEQY